MKKISRANLPLHWLRVSTAQQQYASGVNWQTSWVENIPSGGLAFPGKFYSLSERRKHNHVQGTSMAVIGNYQIVWAKGYGYADKKRQEHH